MHLHVMRVVAKFLDETRRAESDLRSHRLMHTQKSRKKKSGTAYLGQGVVAAASCF